MASVIVTVRIMPVSPEVDLVSIEKQAKGHITSITGKDEFKVEVKPVAFGLKSLDITYIASEEKGSTEPVEKALATIEGVNSVEVTDVRRAIG